MNRTHFIAKDVIRLLADFTVEWNLTGMWFYLKSAKQWEYAAGNGCGCESMPAFEFPINNDLSLYVGSEGCSDDCMEPLKNLVSRVRELV